MRRSTSPLTSASTLSSSFNGGVETAATTVAPPENNKEEWATELQPIPSEVGAQRCNIGLEDWESMLSESTMSLGQDHSLMRWIAGDVDDPSFGLKHLLQSGSTGTNMGFGFEGNAGLGVVDQGSLVCSGSGFPISGFVPNANNNENTNIQNPIFASPVQHHENQNDKPQILIGQQQNPQYPNFFMPLAQEHHLLQPLPKRLNPGNLQLSSQIPKHHMGFSQGVQFVPLQQPLVVEEQKTQGPGEQMARQHQHHLHQQQQATLFDQLYKAADLVGNGNFSHAQLILARLNQQVSPVGTPLQRATFYFKEALQLLILMKNPVSPPPPRSPTPFTAIFKMGAYKVFSEVSPLIQFANFTCNQALLEALDDADRIHIVDFDIGFGAQWASFMQELPMRSRGAPSLRITAFASSSMHHPIELGLMRESLMQFANEIGVSFDLDVLNFDSLDQNPYSLPMFQSNGNEAVAVNFPVWSSSNRPAALSNLMRFVKQLSPKIVVSLDQGCDRNDLPYAQHVIHAFQSYISLLESLDVGNVTSDDMNKIERFLLVPRIESTVLGSLQAPEKMPLWKTLFSSAGFSPVTFSNITETQADCVVKRAQTRGFHVEKRQASLVLCWQQRDLISASAWTC